jgi:hypothetical protein
MTSPGEPMHRPHHDPVAVDLHFEQTGFSIFWPQMGLTRPSLEPNSRRPSPHLPRPYPCLDLLRPVGAAPELRRAERKSSRMRREVTDLIRRHRLNFCFIICAPQFAVVNTSVGCGARARVPRTMALLAEARELRRLAGLATDREVERCLLAAAAQREDKSFALARWLSEFRADPAHELHRLT